MSLLWADNFNLFGVGGHLVAGNGRDHALEGCYVQCGNDANFNGCAFAADPDPTSNGYSVLRFVPQAGSRYEQYIMQLRKVLPTSKTEVGMFARLWWASFSADYENGPMIRFADSVNVTNIWLQVTPIGTIKVWRGIFNNAEPALLGETAVCLTASAWHHIEARVLFSNTVGEVEINVNGFQKLNLTNVDTVYNNTNCQVISVATRATGTGGGGNVYWKDFVIWDTAGTVNNDFFGTCEVGPYMPNSDISFNWSASTGVDGYPLIDEVNGPNDADYISASVAQTTASEFGVENLDPEVTSVRGFLIFTRAQKSDGGDCQIQAGVKSSGDATLCTDRPITAAQTYWTDVVELDPHTGFQFSPTGFNNMSLTIDRTV